MDYKRGDIVVVNFASQYDKLDVGDKIRHAIIVSDTNLNQVIEIIAVVMLTTEIVEDAEPLRLHLPKRENMKSDYDAMIEHLRTISKTRVEKYVTSVTPDEMKKIEDGIKAILAL